MRILYFLLKVTLNYSLRVFYPRLKLNNSPKELLGRTIYVSNHPASFMDPLAVASLRMPIVFFMTRSDIFNKVTQPFLWACHMLPIYRQHDGEDVKAKNEAVFKKCTRILGHGRNLLIFGEGFTDDTFIRRLKPLKKGAARIGMQTLVEQNWKHKIYVAAVGCNYSDPNQMRSDLLVSTSEKILLNDYKKEYLENPNKVITELTKRIEKMMQEQITHVSAKENAPFHEEIMCITRKGMNARNFDRSLSLTDRWNYSKGLANWMNLQSFEEGSELNDLKSDSESYFKLLKRFRIKEEFIYWKLNDGSRMKEILMMVLLFPFAIIGLIHCFVPYVLAKKFVEKSFKRKVFWGSVKLIAAQLLIAIFNIPTFFLFYYFAYPSWLLATAYFLSIGLTGLAAYMWFVNLKRFKTKGAIIKMDLTKIIEKRKILEEKIRKIVPAEFS